MDFSPCFSPEAKYIRFGLFWVVLCFLFIAVPESQGQLLCVHWARGPAQGDDLGSLSLCRATGTWILGWAANCRHRGWAPPRCAILGFLFTSVVILSFTIQVPLFFSPFLPVLSTGKLLRGLIRLCFWDLFPWQLRVGFWVLSKLSEVKDYCTLFILNFQSVMDWYFCKILKKKLNYEKSDIKNKDIQNTNLIFFSYA